MKLPAAMVRQLVMLEVGRRLAHLHTTRCHPGHFARTGGYQLDQALGGLFGWF